LQVGQLSVLRVVGQLGLSHAKLVVNVINVAHCKVSQIGNLLLEMTQSCDVFMRVSGELLHVNIVDINILAINSDTAFVH
jgi:hypothetical protein